MKPRILLPILLIALLAGCAGKSGRRKPLFRFPSAKTTVPCPLCGQEANPDAISRRPLAVMIENHPRARPQSGLSQACVVYEAPAEGGISRFMAIYLHEDAKKIGPIRSARPYFISWMMEYQAAYAHCGQSMGAAILISDLDIPNLDEMHMPKPFWRDKSRRAPHNLYSSTSNLWKEVKARGWDLPLLSGNFDFSDQTGSGSAAVEKVRIAFPAGYRVEYRYDSRTETYLRLMKGKPHQEALTGKQLAATNLILQYVDSRPSPEGKGTLELDIIGSGYGDVLMGGHQTPAKWVKSSDFSPTTFYDFSDSKIPLRPGQTWIIVVPNNAKVKFSAP